MIMMEWAHLALVIKRKRWELCYKKLRNYFYSQIRFLNFNLKLMTLINGRLKLMLYSVINKKKFKITKDTVTIIKGYLLEAQCFKLSLSWWNKCRGNVVLLTGEIKLKKYMKNFKKKKELLMNKFFSYLKKVVKKVSWLKKINLLNQ